MSNEVILTDAEFDKTVGESQLPILVDFWAPWCGPCRFMEPILAQLAQDKSGVLRVGKLNVDDNQRVAQMFGITGIPTMILFKNGRPVERIVGALSRDALERVLAPHLG